MECPRTPVINSAWGETPLATNNKWACESEVRSEANQLHVLTSTKETGQIWPSPPNYPIPDFAFPANFVAFLTFPPTRKSIITDISDSAGIACWDRVRAVQGPQKRNTEKTGSPRAPDHGGDDAGPRFEIRI